MAAKDSGSSVLQCGLTPGAVQRTVARSEGKTGCLLCLGRSLWLARLWLLPDVRGGWDSVADTRGILVVGGSVMLGPLAWPSCWAEVSVDVVAPVLRIWVTMVVTA